MSDKPGDDIQQQKNKPHRDRKAGRKAERKKAKKGHVQELTDRQRNPKAFAINSVASAERKFRRKQDIKTKKQHIPVVDRTPLEPPPILVAVVGPPKVGKSTLIRCLIKSYTRQPLTTLKGPITIVSGKKRRITIVECNNDINSMIDIAKIADLVLLIIDASFGFEMEVFEFLNVCQVHGMPKIMGVLTHLDMIKQTKRVQKTKKTLKRRFWTEVYAGAKLFYLSGMLHGQYLKNEIKNLARFISVMKFRPLTWQTTHPYLIADRMEDVTPPEVLRSNPKSDRNVSLYGYMRGIPMNKNSFLHIAGCGDFEISDMHFLPDPCPLPQQQKKRSLVEKERLVYAPFSGVGGIVYDKDAVYVELPNASSQQKSNTHTQEMVSSILETKETLDEKLAKSELQLFSGGDPIISKDFEKQNVPKERNYEKVTDENDGRERRKVLFDDDSDDENEIMEDENEFPVGSKKRKHSKGSSDDSDSDEHDSSIKTAKEMKLDEGSRFKRVQTDQDRLIRDKISNVLSSLGGSSKVDGEEWSGDSSSDDEEDDQEENKVSKKVPWATEWSGNDDESDAGSGEDSEASDNNDDDDDDDDDELGSEEDGDEELDADVNWKSNLAQKAAKSFLDRQKSVNNLWKLVYDENYEPNKVNEEDEIDELGGLFTVVRKKQESQAATKDLMDAIDSSLYPNTYMKDWTSQDAFDSIKDCFVTGKWKEEEDAQELLKLDDLSEDEEELYGDFEDLETGEKFEGKKKDSSDNKTEANEEMDEDTKKELIEKKKKLKEKFDAEYDNKDDEETTYFDEWKSEMNKQAELNKTLFEGIDDSVRVQLEGFRAGMYVRIEIRNAPCELVDNFDPTYPLIIGGLQPGEQNIGFVKARIKKHRWYNKILKSGDPIIVSMGWRRFQTVSIFSKQEDNLRHRMLKYTPEHVACMAHFWGPMTKAGTGFFVLLNAPKGTAEQHFRIIASGTVVDTNQSTVVTKKLKLTGVPLKIYKKTAFIKGMFTSSLEVAKFEGAKIKTVSGVRGQIKKAAKTPEGAFRATFEDKILLSDIVFCRTWYRVDVPKFYTPVTSLLLPVDSKNSWQGMKTVGQLKRERGIKNAAQPDSLYTEIVRPQKVARPLVVPRAVEKELPYRFKTKEPLKLKKNPGAYMKLVSNVVIRDEHESKVSSMMDKLRMSFDDKVKKEEERKKKSMAAFIKRKQEEDARKYKKHKAIKKKIYRSLGLVTKNNAKM